MNLTNTFGFNPGEVAQLATLAALVQQIGPTLGLPEGETRQLLDGANALQVEAAAAAPDQGRLRRAAEWVSAGLGAASKTTAALTVLVQACHSACSAVFGG